MRPERSERLPEYLVRCASCEMPMDPEREALRGTCYQCGKRYCDECKLTNPPEWKGLCAFCTPGNLDEKWEPQHRDDKERHVWVDVNRLKAERRDAAALRAAERKRKKLTGR